MKTKTLASKSARALKLNRILVPTDFSRHAAHALRYAVPLARQLGGKITLMHAFQWPVVPTTLSRVVRNEDKPTRAANEKLAKLAAASVPAELMDRTVARLGASYREIVRAARGLKMDLIVVATQGHTGLKHALLGSTAERVVRHAACPVLTVRREAGVRTPERKATGLRPDINRILVPVDFSPLSEKALRFAAGLAGTMGARLAILHVVEPLPVGIFSRFPDELARSSAETLRQARRQLDALAAHVPKDLRVQTLLRRDAPGQGILHAAREWRSDLIVLPTRGLTGVKYIVLGSTAEAVVRHAQCPVLTLGRACLKNQTTSTPSRP
jgi:nucleotide-binding universal stress UspA family protein